jgi:hypothetical protein
LRAGGCGHFVVAKLAMRNKIFGDAASEDFAREKKLCQETDRFNFHDGQ